MRKKQQLFFSVLMAIVMMTLCPSRMWADVTISDGKPETLKAAFDAAASSSAPVTIKLESDITGGNWKDPFFTLTSGTITLDLNDHKIQPSTNTAIKVAGTDLTIVDNGTNKAGEINGLEFNSGSLQLCGGTISNKLFVTKNSTTLADILGEGCYFTDTNGNTLSTSGTGEWKTYVIKSESAITEADANLSVTINGEIKYYKDFTKAFAKAAEGTTETPATIKLLKEYINTSNWTEPYYTFNSGVVTLDLNGLKFSPHCNHAIKVDGSANLTIEDNSTNKSGELKGIMYSNGSLTLHGGKYGLFEVGSGSYWNRINMDGYCFVNSDNKLYTPQTNTTNPQNLTVKPFTVEYAVASVTIGETTTLYKTIKDAFDAANSATSDATITLQNDYSDNNWAEEFYTFTNTSAKISLDLNGHSVTPNTRYAIEVNGADLTIVDNGDNKVGALKGVKYTSGKVTINGGKFTKHDNNDYSFYNTASSISDDAITLHGGEYVGGINIADASNWSKLGMADYYFVDTLTNSVVTPQSNSNSISTAVAVRSLADLAVASVKIGDDTNYYLSLPEAFTDASEGTAETPATVTLLKNIEMTEGITLEKGVITLDLNGNTLEITSSSALVIKDNANLTINDATGKGMVKASSYAVLYDSGKLTINGGNYQGTYALWVNKENLTKGDVTLHGGTFYKDNSASIRVESDWLNLGMDTYCFVDTSNGEVILPTNNSIENNVTVVPVTPELANASVKIGESGTPSYYVYLEKAFEQASNGTEQSPATVTLLKNVKTSSGSFYYITLKKGVINFDLNGNTIDAPYTLMNISGAKLTINDATGKGKLNAGTTAVKYSSGKLTINGGIYYGKTNCGLYLPNNLAVGNVTLHGGTFYKGDKGYSISAGNNDSDWSKLGMDTYCFVDTISGEVILPNGSSISYSVKVQPITAELANASVEIGGTTSYYVYVDKAFAKAADGTESSPATVTLLKNISLTPNHIDYITLTKGVINFDLNGDTLDVTKADVVLKITENANLTINDATGKGMLKSNYYPVYYTGGKLTINGGIFHGKSLALNISKNDLSDRDVTLHGGIYQSDEWGSIQVENGDTDWNKLGMDGYCFLDENGDIVEPEANVSSINKQVTVDLVATKIDIYGAEMQNVSGYWAVFGGDEKLGLTLATKNRTDFEGAFTTDDMFLYKGQNCTFLCLDGKYYDITSINFTVAVDGSDKTFKGTFYSNGKKYNFMMTTKSKPLPPVSLEIESSVLTPGNGYWSVYGNDGKYYLSLGTNTRTDFDGSFATSDMYIDNGDGCTYLYTIVAGQPSYKEITDINFTVTKAGEAKTFTGTILTADGVTVNFVMVNRPRLVLDEKAVNPTSYDTETEYDLTVNREMKNGKWNTLCLPFSMSADEVEATFGEGTELKVIDDVTKDEDEYNIYFEDATAITAGEMYIIKPSSSYNFTITANPKTLSDVSGSKTFGDVTVSSSFYRSDINAAGLSSETSTYIMNDEKFYHVDSDIVFKGFRWYVTIPSNEGNTTAKLVANIDGISTEIINTKVENANNGTIYNIAGQRVSGSAKGIVIMNGKKYIVK